MGNEDFGESSSKRSGSDDKMSDSERPLKKARFAWQVKGRYHLKNQESNNQNAPTEIIATPEVIETFSGLEADADITSKAEENLEILGDYLLKKDFSSLNPFIISSFEAEPLKETISQSMEDTNVPMVDSDSVCEVVEDIETSASVADVSQSSGDEGGSAGVSWASMTLGMPQHQFQPQRTEDQQLARWQARQLAKGFVDNTINRVLDSWLVAPLPQAFEDNHHLALDVAEFLDNLPTDNRVENEGILMAISAHGLQNSLSSPRREDSRSQNRLFNPRNAESSFNPRSFGGLRNRSLSDTALIDEYFQKSLSTNSRDLAKENDSHAYNDDSDSSDECHVPKLISDETMPSDNERNMFDVNRFKCHVGHGSEENRAWTHIAEPCNCSNTQKRSIANILKPNIPFHRRDIQDYRSLTINNLEETAQSANAVSSSDPPMEASEVSNEAEDKSSDASSDEEDYRSSGDQNKNSFPGSSSREEQFGEHFDFMDAAVSFAIQNKGLTPFGSIDYG